MYASRLLLALAVALTVVLGVSPVRAQDGVLDANGTDYIDLYYPGWTHSDLTIAVKAGRAVDDVTLAAVNDAIALWTQTLSVAFGGAVTLTNVTGDRVASAQADIRVVLTNSRAGGNVFGAFALCLPNAGCTIVESSVLHPVPQPQPGKPGPYPYEWSLLTAAHELGHALGLAHAQPIESSTDLMGYGAFSTGDPSFAISECDLAGLAIVWAWALEGSDPRPPDAATVDCG